ncbi:trichoplein keratin filament-binding protein isoform X1 [Cataglyphis hispanica]|uniref:trichoplein keratin filament-binding protein isoform X1 n=2 Tax=Cataglyphis hispanica TaxID=1086592 RepID=UPI00217FDD3C|nr:trichoplein keratin filament-binding protein isoform X1 [Cataglyphis hispanica]
MSEPLTLFISENKLNELNKNIVEIKKKIQLSESQRKANFEEYDAKKRENAQKIADLKKEIKELYVKYAGAKTNKEAMERAAVLSHDLIACSKKGNLEEIIATASENNIRLRKKLDLIKYEREKQEETLNVLQTERKELARRRGHCVFKRKTEKPMKKKIENLEVRLEHIRMMQIRANISRMKYRSVSSNLKEKSVFYASSLKDLEDSIRQQENEIKRLQGVKEEAIELRDNTQETLVKEEIEEINSSKKRDSVIKECRQRVLERKMELERLERMIFHTRRDDFETRGKNRTQAQEDIIKDELARLEETFAKLRNATGVSRSEEVLNRFLGQQATKESLQKMRAATEQEKMMLEKKRQQLSAEMETRKFSETKSAEQNAEIVAKLNSQIDEQQRRKERAEVASQRVREVLNDVTSTLYKLYEKFQHVTGTPVLEDIKMDDTLAIIELLSDKVKHELDVLSASDKYLEAMDEVLLEKLETMSVATTSAEGRTMRANTGRPLFPQFPSCAIPAAPLSEDEEEVPSRNGLKRQAQLLVDTKSRRKGFAFRR